MSARAKAKKVQGVVVDGRVRDLSEHRSMEYPVSFCIWAHKIITQWIHAARWCAGRNILTLFLCITRCLPSRIPRYHKTLS